MFNDNRITTTSKATYPITNGIDNADVDSIGGSSCGEMYDAVDDVIPDQDAVDEFVSQPSTPLKNLSTFPQQNGSHQNSDSSIFLISPHFAIRNGMYPELSFENNARYHQLCFMGHIISFFCIALF